MSDDAILVEILKRILRSDDNCVDVGANLGQILRHMVRLAPRGRHRAFEALPHLADRIRNDFPLVEVHAVALSDDTAEAPFHHVINDPGYSGLRQRRYDRPDPKIEILTVPVRRLDDLLPIGEKIRFIKIDVEGAELQVLKGATRTIGSQHPYVYFEHGIGGSDFYGTTPELVYELLVDELHLDICTPRGWLSGDNPLTKRQFRQSFDAGHIWNYFAYS